MLLIFVLKHDRYAASDATNKYQGKKLGLKHLPNVSNVAHNFPKRWSISCPISSSISNTKPHRQGDIFTEFLSLRLMLQIVSSNSSHHGPAPFHPLSVFRRSSWNLGNIRTVDQTISFKQYVGCAREHGNLFPYKVVDRQNWKAAETNVAHRSYCTAVRLQSAKKKMQTQVYRTLLPQ